MSITAKPVQAPAQHLDYLDSTRGIAALMVIAYHYFNWKYASETGAKIGSVIFNGSDAVSFFFVLSGFVLSYKYIVLNEPLDIRKFYVTRMFRLWPAYFITLVVCALYVYRGDLSLHNLVRVFIFNRSSFWQEAFLFRSHPYFYLPGWTLVIELILSFFIPFVIALAKYHKPVIYWLLIAYVIIGNGMGNLYMFHIHFTLGVLVSCLFHQVKDASFRQTKWYRYRHFITGAAFLFFSARHIDRLWPFGKAYDSVTGFLGISFFHYSALASVVFIIAIIRNPGLQKILRLKPLLFLGKISYGIYLMHWFLVTDVIQNWDRNTRLFPNSTLAFFVVFLIYTFLTIILATVLHYAIEMPFIRMGKRLTTWLKPSLQIQ